MYLFASWLYAETYLTFFMRLGFQSWHFVYSTVFLDVFLICFLICLAFREYLKVVFEFYMGEEKQLLRCWKRITVNKGCSVDCWEVFIVSSDELFLLLFLISVVCSLKIFEDCSSEKILVTVRDACGFKGIILYSNRYSFVH